jgi:predicted component of type VI protein secretion system
MIHPNFTPDITLGHLMQALVVLSTVGGGIVGGYVSLRADLDLQRAEFRVAVARHEARLSLAEHQLDQRHSEERQFQAEMRGALDRVMQAIADLRTELVQKQNRKQQ